MTEPHFTPPTPSPSLSAPPTLPAPPARAARFSFLSVALTFSFLFNCGAVVVLAIVCFGVLTLRGVLDPDAGANAPLSETVYSGSATARDKIAIIHVEGVIIEGNLSYPHKQIEQAVEDDQVKAIVLRINSPGGSITASDDLHRRIVNLQEGKTPAKTGGKIAAKKPVVVSMGSLAASGGYYIAAPAHTILAEPTTMTASIGVYSAFPNVKKLGDQYGFGMTTIKQGEIKDSGSPFKDMSDHERQVWQDMVDHAYLQFLAVVESGRNNRLKVGLLEPFDVYPMKGQGQLRHPAARETPQRHLTDGGLHGILGATAINQVPYKRYLADGGIFTADKAKQHGLIDQIGYLEDAILIAHQAANLGNDFKTIQYDRPQGLAERLLGVQTRPGNTGLLDLGQVKNGFVPRLWYLMPGSEVSGMLAGMETLDTGKRE